MAKVHGIEVGPGFGRIQINWKKMHKSANSLMQDLVDDLTICHWPLPQSVLGTTTNRGELNAAQMSLEYSRPTVFNKEAFGIMLTKIDSQSVRLVQSAEGYPRFIGSGSTIPWIIIGAGIRWFADDTLDQEGRVDLRTMMDTLKKSGAWLTPKDRLAGVPMMTEAELNNASAVWKNFGDKYVPLKIPNRSQLAQNGLPCSDSESIRLAREIVTKAQLLPPTSLNTLILRWKEKKLFGNGELIGVTHGKMKLLNAGLILAVGGETVGLDACETVLQHESSMDTVEHGVLRLHTLAERDRAYFAVMISGTIDSGRLTKWIDEPCIHDFTKAWRIERLYVGERVEQWLDHADESSSQHIFAPRNVRAWTSGDLAKLLSVYLELEKNMPVTIPASSIRCDFLTPEVVRVSTECKKAVFYHAFIRLAARIWLQSKKGPLPVDSTTLTKVLGQPLNAPFGDIPVPLTYEHRNTCGFRLALNLSGEIPARFPKWIWGKWAKNQPNNGPGIRVALGNLDYLPEIIVDLEAKPIPDDPTGKRAPVPSSPTRRPGP